MIWHEKIRTIRATKQSQNENKLIFFAIQTNNLFLHVDVMVLKNISQESQTTATFFFF